MLIIGLTGGIATGKSTVSKMFQERGIPVLDADRVAHELMMKGTSVYHQIIDTFGEGVILSNGELDRKTIGNIVFNDERLRNRLNAIVHPEVKRVMLNGIEVINREKKSSFVILDVPLLFESGFDDICDVTVVVYTDEETQLKRLMARNHYTEEEALKRIRAQMPMAKKVELADYIIDNSKTVSVTQKQVEVLIEEWSR